MSTSLVEWRCPVCRARGTADSPFHIDEVHAQKQPRCDGLPTIVDPAATFDWNSVDMDREPLDELDALAMRNNRARRARRSPHAE